MTVTRLAPSPTGALHLGNARTFLINWAVARRLGWRILLRVENLDGPRVKRGADEAAIEDLRWLGLDWDDGPILQSDRSPIYQEAVEQLIAGGQAYPCICTRKEIDLAASAPHAEDGSTIYPGTCRGRFKSLAEARMAAGREPAIRFQVPDDDSAIVHWNDLVRGPQTIDVRSLGDFVIQKLDGTAAYQLAVVVDDADAGVTHIVRGDDLVDSTPRQILLYRALGAMDRLPEYGHLPLVIGTDGRRLAKRHGDTRISYYRERGVPVGRSLALLARWCGVAEAAEYIEARELIDRLSLERVPKVPVVFSADDDAWLLSKSVPSESVVSNPLSPHPS